VNASSRRAALLLVPLLAAGSCRSPPSSDTVDTPASPQATAEPAPLANIPAQPAPGIATAALAPDGSSPATPLRGDRPVEADPPGHETTAYTLLAVLRASDPPPTPKGPEINPPGLEAARKKTDPLVSIDFTSTRARIVLTTAGFALPMGTELRARSDRFGHIVLDPDGATYRVAAPGVLRALLGERRLDVAPLSGAQTEDLGDGPKRVGRSTHKIAVVTRAAKADFEITHVPDGGEGGGLVCRALLDLINAPPSTPLCGDGDVPLHVELRWTAPAPSALSRSTRSSMITFDAYALARRDVSPLVFATPPGTAAYDEALPDKRSLVLLTAPELAALHVGADAEAETTLGLVNSTDELRFLWLDGVPIAWLAPGARETLRALPRGHYSIQWRTFLGDAIDPAQTVTLPATSDIGSAEAGP
jgi:hypothetical protein